MAASASLSVVPTNGNYNYTVGDTINVTIHESSVDPVNAVEADFTYDATKLQFASLSPMGSFDLAGPTTGGGGVVKIPVAKSGSSLTGDQVVGSAKFTVLAPGATAFSFITGTSQVVTPGPPAPTNIWDNTKNITSATFTLVAAGTGTTTPPPPPPPPPGNTNKAITTTKAAVTTPVTTSTPVTATTPTSVPAPTVQGYYVAIKVTDANGKLVSGASVSLDDQTTTTNSSGIASFIGVGSGTHTVTATVNGKKITQSITVAAASTHLDVQQFGVKVAGSKITNLIWIIVLLVALIAIGGGGLTFGQILTRQHRAAAMGGASADAAPVTTTPPPAAPPVTGSSGDTNPTGQIFYPATGDSTPPDEGGQQ